MTLSDSVQRPIFPGPGKAASSLRMIVRPSKLTVKCGPLAAKAQCVPLAVRYGLGNLVDPGAQAVDDLEQLDVVLQSVGPGDVVIIRAVPQHDPRGTGNGSGDRLELHLDGDIAGIALLVNAQGKAIVRLLRALLDENFVAGGRCWIFPYVPDGRPAIAGQRSGKIGRRPAHGGMVEVNDRRLQWLLRRDTAGDAPALIIARRILEYDDI